MKQYKLPACFSLTTSSSLFMSCFLRVEKKCFKWGQQWGKIVNWISTNSLSFLFKIQKGDSVDISLQSNAVFFYPCQIHAVNSLMLDKWIVDGTRISQFHRIDFFIIKMFLNFNTAAATCIIYVYINNKFVADI